jgi:hypothetical protein
MKLTKLIAAMVGGLALTFVVVGLTFAAPATATIPTNRAMLEPTITPTVTLTPTVTPSPTATVPHTHPVGLAISLYFHLPYTEVIALHDSGVGFGVIARAYLTAKASNGVLTPTQVLAMFQAGMGWGQFKHQYGIRPGGNGLGSIMSGHATPVPTLPPSAPGKGHGSNGGGPAVNNPGPGNPAACPGNSCNAPGHNKPGKGPKK